MYLDKSDTNLKFRCSEQNLELSDENNRKMRDRGIVDWWKKCMLRDGGWNSSVEDDR
jgi:hypothetical protein